MSRICFYTIVIAALSTGLAGLGAGCTINLGAPSSDDGNNTGSGAGGDTDTTGGTTDTTSEEPNPNSPCSDGTNISVTYVNESSARVTFVENFRNQSNQAVASKMVLLAAAGDEGALQDKCITCPWQASIRNIDFIASNGNTNGVPPPDLMRGSFKCGDHITFTFKADYSIRTTVGTP